MSMPQHSDSAPSLRPAVLLVALGALLAPISGTATAASPVVERAEYVMGTVARIAIPLDRDVDRVSERSFEEAFGAIRAVDRSMSLYQPGSELLRVNAHAGQHAERVGKDLFQILTRAKELSAATNGAFDVTVLPLLRAWGGYRELEHLGPSDPGAVGFAALRLDRNARSVRFDLPGMAVDLGGVAKGFALDRARERLRARGVTQARLDLGGNLALLGGGPTGCWRVAVRDPAHRERPLGVLELPDDYAVATSANYARDFAREGWRAPSHVYDPRTRQPVLTRGAVTVWAPDATTADALATAFLVLGPEEARSVLDHMPGVGVLFATGTEHQHVRFEGAPACNWHRQANV